MPFSKRPVTLNNKAYNIFRDNLIEIHMSNKCEYCDRQRNELLEMDRRFTHLIKNPKVPVVGVKAYPSIIIKDKSNGKNIILMGYKTKKYILSLASILDKHNN